MQSVFVPTDPYEKKLQRTLLQYWKPENRRLVIEALVRAGREDLIGHGPDCLVQPDREYLISRRAAGQGGPDPKLTAKPHPGARRPKSTHRKNAELTKDAGWGPQARRVSPAAAAPPLKPPFGRFGLRPRRLP